jgi:hypothetical protein
VSESRLSCHMLDALHAGEQLLGTRLPIVCFRTRTVTHPLGRYHRSPIDQRVPAATRNPEAPEFLVGLDGDDRRRLPRQPYRILSRNTA